VIAGYNISGLLNLDKQWWKRVRDFVSYSFNSSDGIGVYFLSVTDFYVEIGNLGFAIL